MKVKLFAGVRLAAGVASVEMDTPPDVRSLLDELARRYGKELEESLLDAEGRLVKGAVILVNGRNVHSMEGLDTALGEGDGVSIFPPIGGG